MNQPLDKETQKIIREGTIISDFTKSDGWNLAKARLLEKVTTLDSLTATLFENKTPEALVIELQARAGAIALVKEWLSDVEGWAEQHNSNNQETNVQEEIIVRL